MAASRRPKHLDHRDKTQHVGKGYVIVRRLVGYGTNPKVSTIATKQGEKHHMKNITGPGQRLLA